MDIPDSIDDVVGADKQPRGQKTNHRDREYADTYFTRFVGGVLDTAEKYVGNPIVYAVEKAIDGLHRIGVVKYLDKHGNVVDKKGKIIQPTNVTPINKGEGYKQKKDSEGETKK